MNNITRTKRNAEIVTGEILVTCKVTIDGLGTHSGTGEEWADEDNAMTSAEAQAFKRACSCFGLGRYFYDFDAPWVDIDEKGRPKKAPSVAPWIVLNIQANHATFGVKINYQAVTDFLRVRAGLGVQLDIKRIGFGIIVQLHVSSLVPSWVLVAENSGRGRRCEWFRRPPA
jgi:hypothetical protein